MAASISLSFSGGNAAGGSGRWAGGCGTALVGGEGKEGTAGPTKRKVRRKDFCIERGQSLRREIRAASFVRCEFQLSRGEFKIQESSQETVVPLPGGVRGTAVELRSADFSPHPSSPAKTAGSGLKQCSQ